MREQLDLTKTNLEIAVANVDQLENEEYALARRQGFGASDMSVILGVLPYKNLNELIEEKRRGFVTEEEEAIGKKVNVRKGRDLEPMIISRTEAILGTTLVKPTDMYRVATHPWMTVNFDGVTQNSEGVYIPVECKFVSIYGDKYYNKDKAIFKELSPDHEPVQDWLRQYSDADFKDYLEARAELVGIPAYYYTQVQHQIFALNAPFGYLAALHDRTWEVCGYAVARDDKTINKITAESWKAWQQVQK